jgi:hypothetical protein
MAQKQPQKKPSILKRLRMGPKVEETANRTTSTVSCHGRRTAKFQSTEALEPCSKKSTSFSSWLSRWPAVATPAMERIAVHRLCSMRSARSKRRYALSGSSPLCLCCPFNTLFGCQYRVPRAPDKAQLRAERRKEAKAAAATATLSAPASSAGAAAAAAAAPPSKRRASQPDPTDYSEVLDFHNLAHNLPRNRVLMERCTDLEEQARARVSAPATATATATAAAAAAASTATAAGANATTPSAAASALSIPSTTDSKSAPSAPSSSASSSSSSGAAHGSVEWTLPLDAQIWRITGKAGFYVITRAISASAQWEWAKTVLREYSGAEHTNLYVRCLSPLSLCSSLRLLRLCVACAPATHSTNLKKPAASWAQAVSLNSLAPLQELRWASLGYHYDWTARCYRPERYSPFPAALHALGARVAACVGYPALRCEAGIVNYYPCDTTMGAHVDDAGLCADLRLCCSALHVPCPLPPCAHACAHVWCDGRLCTQSSPPTSRL